MAEHTFEETVQLAVKLAIIKQHPIGSLYLTMGNEDPSTFIGGGWQKLTGRYVLQCSDENHKAGTTVEAGLPNITGNIPAQMPGSMPPWTNKGKGALFNNYARKDYNSYNSNNTYIIQRSSSDKLEFDASRSNPIYGRSDTVQPPARIVNVWKRVS